MAYTFAGQYNPNTVFGWDPTTRTLTYLTSCAVYNPGTNVLATLYQDRAKAGSLTNPLPAGVADGAAGISGTGNVMFFVAPGQYELLINGVGNRLPITVGPDPADSQSTVGALPPAPDGRTWKIVVDNNGGLSTVLVDATPPPITGGGGGVVPPVGSPSTTTYPDGTLDNTINAGTGTNQFEYVGNGGTGVGSWTSAYPTGGKSTTEHYTFTPGDFLRYRLPTGRTGVTFIGELGPGEGQVGVTVNGGSSTTYDMYSASTQAGATLFHLTGLNPAIANTIVITVLATKNAASAGYTLAVEQAIPEVTTTTATTFNTDGLAFTAFTVTPTGSQTSAVLRTCTFSVTASKALTLQDVCGAVRSTVLPNDVPDLDFPHTAAAVTFAAGDTKTFTTTRSDWPAGSFNVYPAYNLNGVWTHLDTGPIVITVTTAPPASTGTNPLGIGVKSGLTWNSGMWGTGDPHNEAANRAVYEAGRGRAGDLVGAVAVGGDWGSIEGLPTIALMPKDRPCIIDVTPWPGSSGNWTDMAAGMYNSHYYNMGATAANSATNGGHPVIIRLAWEFNGGGVNGVAPATFIQAWRNAYNQAKAGAGAHPERVLFNWSLMDLRDANGQSVFNYYPGDGYVDILGIDNYDNTPHAYNQAQFDSQQASIYNTFYNFCQAHGKLMALDEWGGAADNGGTPNDNPFYIQAMYAWIRAHKAGLAYEMYFQCLLADGNPVNNALYSPTIEPNARNRYALEITAG